MPRVCSGIIDEMDFAIHSFWAALSTAGLSSVLEKWQFPLMGTSFRKRGAIGEIHENGATRAAMNPVIQHHAKTCVALWERRFDRLGEDFVQIPGQRFFVF